MNKLKIHMVVLPRWFAAPVAAMSVLLGCILAGVGAFPATIATIAGLCLMATAHTWNSFHDYVFTGFDKGNPGEISREKIYTGAQNLLAMDVIKPFTVLTVALSWWAVSFVLVLWIAVHTNSLLPFIPWALISLCAPWYSEAKKLWHPEVPLGLGFSTFAIWLGMSASGSIDWWKGFLVSIPIFILFGVVCEAVDQGIDAEVNWSKGLRNLGAWLRLKAIPTSLVIIWGLLITFVAQKDLVIFDIIPAKTFITLFSIPIFFWSVWVIDRDFKKGLILGLLAVFLYQLLYLMGMSPWNWLWG